MKEKPSPNRLIHEKSPYLQQHAYNPVEWYPWGEEAFERAKRENKPVFLSIGYSTCHWCHVMAHESFENPDVARLMNDYFVNVKVDREERPDIDKIYMKVSQIMAGSGGWPLTIIMTPDKKPFFAGTYIPRENRFGRPGMMELLPRVNEIWKTRRNEAIESAGRIVAELRSRSGDIEKGTPEKSILVSAYDQLAGIFDNVNGGFGGAPKFPSPHNLVFLLRYWKRSGNAHALHMVEKTLQAMRRGGIYDHVGFGFHRYSVDEKWFLPHFEKMLYDQAMLSFVYSEAYQATGRKEYEKTAREVFSYVLDRMTAPTGGFYSAEDADSEGEEGKFYLWTKEEVEGVLDTKEAAIIIDRFGLKGGGNFQEEGRGGKTGRNILSLQEEPSRPAGRYGLAERERDEAVERARRKLYDLREERVHPLKDQKILADWNGLMIAALAKGGQVFDETGCIEAAERATEFILSNMMRGDGRLLHCFKDNESGIAANLDDYAFLIWGLIELFESNFKVEYLRRALALTDDLINYFWDEKEGGFFFTPSDGEDLIIRQKEIYGGAIPSGNAIAMWNMIRLGHLSSRSELLDRAYQTGSAFVATVSQSPAAYAELMVAFDLAFGPSHEVVVAGIPEARDTKSMLRALRTHFLPHVAVIMRPTDEELPEIIEIAEFTRNHQTIAGKAAAYMCVNGACTVPTTDIPAMLDFLDSSEVPSTIFK
jgi:uncharacterized protein YyaL (SSP411 family)